MWRGGYDNGQMWDEWTFDTTELSKGLKRAKAMASNVVHVTVILDDKKAIAAMLAIRELASSIIEDQPWNDEAKRIKTLARKLLKRVRINRFPGKER